MTHHGVQEPTLVGPNVEAIAASLQGEAEEKLEMAIVDALAVASVGNCRIGDGHVGGAAVAESSEDPRGQAGNCSRY
jgi:hypothetical protein